VAVIEAFVRGLSLTNSAVKILLASYLYSPSVGGIETVSALLAKEFQNAGHEVRILTSSPGASSDALPVFRNPAIADMAALFRWADVVFHNNLSLRFAVPFLTVRKPWVIAHHTWLARPDGSLAAADRFKRAVLRRAANISISPAIARSLPVPSRIIPDPYAAEIFHLDAKQPRTRELIFVGRLVSDKGVDILLNALALLAKDGKHPRLAIAGDGPERSKLVALAREVGLANQVRFEGTITGPALALLLNEHQIMVIPSRWNEPFGVVALEGIACGCAIVATSGGGLPDAVGRCGVLVKNGDAGALANALRELLDEPQRIAALRSHSEAHVKNHHPATIAERYLAVLESLCGGGRN
jgi:glycosyltransferase involved in cell wall biosynthesis